MKKIIPRILKGFRDFSPQDQEIRIYCIDTLQKVFSKAGFLPIDTPILEHEDVLLGKGGGETDKQVYRFEDNGKRSVVMRFDLTIPFARYVTMYKHALPTPFLRYQIGKVFRGENTQKGRYREFLQCDFDIVGTDHVSSDITILQTIMSSFEALCIPNITIHISHRGMLNELLAQYEHNSDISSEQAIVETLRALDKLRKIGADAVVQLLSHIWSENTARILIDFATKEHNNDATLQKIQGMLPQNSQALLRLQKIYSITHELGVSDYIMIDPSITRGLDYYTGFVCETFITNYEDIGSVCSGGRYNNLTQLFDKEEAQGVGASIGLDRLLSIIEEVSTQKPQSSHTKVAVMSQDESTFAYCHSVVHTLQQNDIAAHVYPNSRKMKHFLNILRK